MRGDILTEKEGVARGSHEVTSRITTNDEMTRGMDTHEVIHEVIRRSAALQSFPEGLVVATLEERYNVVIF